MCTGHSHGYIPLGPCHCQEQLQLLLYRDELDTEFPLPSALAGGGVTSPNVEPECCVSRHLDWVRRVSSTRSSHLTDVQFVLDRQRGNHNYRLGDWHHFIETFLRYIYIWSTVPFCHGRLSNWIVFNDELSELEKVFPPLSEKYLSNPLNSQFVEND